MSADPKATHERAAIQHMMRRLDGFTHGLGFDKAAAREIAAEMSDRSDGDRLKAVCPNTIIDLA